MLALVLFAAATFCSVILPIVRYFHDPKGLRKYPGFSPLSGFTDLRHIYLSACGYRSKELYEAHRHAPILRTGPNSLSFGDNQAIKDIYGHGTPCLKDLNYVVLGGSHTHLFDVVDKSDHARQRKTLSAAFAIKNLERWESKVGQTTARLLKAMDAHCTAPLPPGRTIPNPVDVTLDFNKWVYLFTIEAINSIALSSTMNLLDKGTDDVTAQRKDGTVYRARYREAQAQTAYAQSVFVWDYKHYPWLARLSRLHPKWRAVWKQAAPWDDVVYHQAQTRLQRYLAGERLDDFFSALMDDKQGQPNSLEWGAILAQVGAIINAGSDTTAIALTQVLDLLIRHPAQLHMLREELDAVLDPTETVAPYDKVKNLPYLKACLDEALRLLPPTSAALPRRTPPEGARILGEWIPGDTSVSLPIYAAHRDPAVFPDPEAYRPERWLHEADRRRMEPFFIPFSTGARGCLGRNISYLEQAVVLASVVHRYGFALASAEWEIERHEAFNLLLGEMPVKIWRRETGGD
ncbi:putative cytochrome P450 [Aspergillus japonicus CBS 114.51]|uniref:Putative cytochrome P450 n=1 Tax=Aspergillus japonicus CBS 114.51 TaxID=1448312 RepID=A0A8T8WYU5_ASPJA|nr:putative cytochrome P450 [Aspergillus japonicus CBS 114.51]RAH81023.1 putative cytochrome P450 [Aspergillus japonicus CBS 114.51]